MRHHVRMVGFLVGALAAAFELQSCVRDADDCKQNGQCVGGDVVAGGGGTGGTATTGGCTRDEQCNHPNPCVKGACISKQCVYPSVPDDTPLGSGSCETTCQGGNPLVDMRGQLCAGNMVCDDSWQCTACQDNCPTGYECGGDGVCRLAVGGDCQDDGSSCHSGYCVGGKCCQKQCDPQGCQYCDPQGYDACVDHEPYTDHGSCTGTLTCYGGTCGLDIGETCTVTIGSIPCASGNCACANMNCTQRKCAASQ